MIRSLLADRAARFMLAWLVVAVVIVSAVELLDLAEFTGKLLAWFSR